MARLYLKKTLTGFVPADEPSQDLWKKYKLNEVYRGDIVKPRSYQNHKLCMALLTLTWLNLPEKYAVIWPTFDKCRKAIAADAGHCETIISTTGETYTIPGSLSYDALDQVDFQRVFGAMMTICCKILGMVSSELEAEVSRYADQHYGES